MNTLLVKVVPTAVVLAVGGYVVWPYLGPGGGGEAAPGPAVAAAKPAKANAYEIPPELLRPAPVPPPARDPFDDPEERRALVREAVRQRLKDVVKQLEGRRRTRPSVPGQGGRGGAVDGPLSGLTLNATYIQGGRAAAVINGRVYRPGQHVADGGDPDALVLAEVRLHSIVLRQHGRDLELKYGGRPAAAGQARPAAGPPARARKPAKTRRAAAG
jgi:hypothetical protein